MNHHALSDNRQVSRKGRRPKNAIAMTPAERKRAERQRKLDARQELPNWYRLRSEIWEMITSRFLFESADEVQHAMNAVQMAILWQIVSHSIGNKDSKGIRYMLEPESCPMALLLDEFLPYSPQSELRYKGASKTTFFELLSDIADSHEIEREEDEGEQ